jgi:putative spermidine/putrescine transport system ATP-binding protein
MTNASSAPLAIHLVACAKTFPGAARVLEPIDLEIAAGETLVLLGPSGCGKTTTLRLIAGLEQPDAGGRIFFDGADVTAQGIERRNVGMVFQSYALFPNMSVAENIGYGLRIRKLPAAARRTRIREMLRLMRIESLADRRIVQLSGGQRQRVALARALAVRPRALLLDEPLTALDARLRESLRVEIDQLLRQLGITTIYVTHDQSEAMALGDRIVVMSHGRVEQSGTPREIYQQPASHFVADFIGTMNRVRGEFREDGFFCHAGRLPWSGETRGVGEVLFRPEDAHLVADGEDGHLSGAVAASFYLGDRTRLFVDAGEARPLVVDSRARCTLQIGDPVRLRVDAHGVLTLRV